jgi:hypothetical protein
MVNVRETAVRLKLRFSQVENLSCWARPLANCAPRPRCACRSSSFRNTRFELWTESGLQVRERESQLAEI